jgi:membrane-associated phospholipid phosphatase
MSLQLADFLSLTGIATIALPLIGAIISPENTMRYIIVSVVLVVVIVGPMILKQLIKDPRPVGAMNCNALNSGGSAKDEFGMPSGHMALSSFMIFSTLLISTKNPVIWSLGIAWLASVGWARYAKHCHTLAQIIGGTVYGTGVALLLRAVTK